MCKMKSFGELPDAQMSKCPYLAFTFIFKVKSFEEWKWPNNQMPKWPDAQISFFRLSSFFFFATWYHLDTENSQMAKSRFFVILQSEIIGITKMTKLPNSHMPKPRVFVSCCKMKPFGKWKRPNGKITKWPILVASYFLQNQTIWKMPKCPNVQICISPVYLKVKSFGKWEIAMARWPNGQVPKSFFFLLSLFCKVKPFG